MSETTGDEVKDGAPEDAEEVKNGAPEDEAKPENKASAPAEGEGDGKGSPKGEEDKGGVPESYEDFTLPEDWEVPDARLTEFHDFARQRGMSQEDAQAAVDLHTSVMQEFIEKQQEVWDTTRQGWIDKAKSDPDLQDENGSSEAAFAVAKKGALSVGGEALLEALNDTGAGDHPAVIKAFFEVGRRMSEDTLELGGARTDTRTRAQRMYPSMDK